MHVIERRRKRVYFRGQIKLDLCRDWSYTRSFNIQVFSSSAYKCLHWSWERIYKMWKRCFIHVPGKPGICFWSTISAVASTRPTEALASVISFPFVVYSHYKHSSYLGRELNHGPMASVISLPWTLPQSWVFSGYGPDYETWISLNLFSDWKIQMTK